MRVVTKHYIEMYQPIVNGSKFNISVWPIKERDPLKFDRDDIATHFRFFDITEVTLDDGEVLFGNRKNWSIMYYFGTRLNRDELKQLGFLELCEEEDIKSVIKYYYQSQEGFLANPNGLTIDEVKVLRKVEKIKIK